MYVKPIPPDEAEGDVKRIYDSELEADGYISNTALLYSLNPAAWDASDALYDAVRGDMDDRRYELVTFAASCALRCRYCVSAHGDNLMKSQMFDRSEVEAITRDYRTAGLAPLDVAVMNLAEKVALEAYRVTPDDVESLRRHGLSDAEIFNIVLVAAFRAFWSKSLDAMGCEPDEQLAATNDLIELVELRPTTRAAT